MGEAPFTFTLHPSLFTLHVSSLSSSNDAKICITEAPMRTTVNLDEELIEEAMRVTGVQERTTLIHEGLKTLVSRENARRLARLGGSEPQLRSIPRRRSR